MTPASRTWFITGASRGFGRVWALAALARGDRVAATARDTATLDPLVAEHGDAVRPLRLDVTDRGRCFAAVSEAHDRFGRLDVVIRVTLVEPGAFATDWAGDSAVHAAPNPAYDAVREARARSSRTAGDPEATGDAILALVDADDPPLRLFLGTSPLPIAERAYEQRLETWRRWREVSEAAQGQG